MMSTKSRRILLVFGIALLMATGYSVASVGANDGGITIHSGGLDMAGDDIVDDSTTIWDSNNNRAPLSWNQLGIDPSNVSKSDVGLENVENTAQVAKGGDEMNGILTMNSNLEITQNGDLVIDSDAGSVIRSSSSLRELDFDTDDDDAGGETRLQSPMSVRLTSDAGGGNGGPYNCDISDLDGDWICDGSKSWKHDINITHDAIYTSQESPQVRAVYEGKAHIDGRTNVSLPGHFEKTVSDDKPMLRAQVTPQGAVASVGVIEKTDSWIVIDASKEVDVNYRITGIREGYEDKQVVRPKED